MNYDVIIIGGGLVGSSLGLALGQRGFKVAIVEAIAPENDHQPSFDSKAIALSHSSYNIFNQLDSAKQTLWSQLAPYSNPIRQIHVSEQNGFGFTRLHSHEADVPALGYVIESRDLGAELIKAIKQQRNIDYLCPFQLKAIDYQKEFIQADIAHDTEQRTLRAELIVAADGGNSKVRELSNLGIKVFDYKQSAIITTVQCQRSHNYVAYERFTPHGPLAFLPLTNNRCSIVWTHKPAQAKEFMELSHSDFIQNLQHCFGRRLGKILRVGKRVCFPLKRIIAQSCIAPRSVLIGNAAHTLHPIAGQGFNLGLRDVSTLTQVLTEFRNNSMDLGLALDEYQAWQSADQARIIQFTHGLLNLFSNSLPPLKLLRNSGLVLMDNLPKLKKRFAQGSMGMSGRMSLMSRGVKLPKLRSNS